jgi:predicted nucleotidyltransferase
VATWPELDVAELLRRLTAGGVDFVVVGAVAMVLHGSARLTRDLDICFSTDDGNLDALGAVLVELNATLRGVRDPVPFVPDRPTLRRVGLLTLETEAGPLDLMTQPAGAPAYERLRRRADRYDVGGFSVLVASLEDLLVMKRAASRPQDLIDVEELEAIKRLRRRLGR